MNARVPWLIPGLPGIGVLFALVTALVADGFWDVLSWGLLGLPLVVLGAALLRGRRRAQL